jgi:hypothetical protein
MQPLDANLHLPPSAMRPYFVCMKIIDRKAIPALTLLLTCVVGLAAACDSGGETDDEAARQVAQDALRGTWLTECLPTGEDAWGTFAFANEGANGSFTYTMHGDATCSLALATFSLFSEQRVGAPIESIGPGVRELDILYDRLSATALVEDLAVAFEQAGCGGGDVVVGEPVDITATGCFAFKPLADCPADYDIMRIDDDARFYNGLRTENMCVPAGRPTQLNSFAFVRVE